MDEIGTATVEFLTHKPTGHFTRRITRADPRIRINADFLDELRAGEPADWAHLDGDVLTIRDDYGQRFIYRIHWDDHADDGYLAEWPD